MKIKIASFLFTFLLVYNACTDGQQGWVELFDGESLDGWVQKNGTASYEVIDGTITGTTAEGSPNSFLCTVKEYDDFEMEFEVKVDNPLNSGIQIRSRQREETVGESKNEQAGRVYGPQVELASYGNDPSSTGYIFGEATGKGWVTPDADRIKHHHFKPDEWNHIRIRAVGPVIETWVNNNPISNLNDPEISREFPRGFIGLQVHGIEEGTGPYQVSWKNLKIREL